MSLAIHSASRPHAVPRAHAHRRIGDTIADLAARYAAEMNGSDFAAALSRRHLSHRNYVAFIASMYPLVVGFNGALIRSIAKVDHVRHSTFVKTLAQQLEEEQTHNQLWRAMLEVHDVDHEAVYNDLEEYFDTVQPDDRQRFTDQTLGAVRRDLRAGDAGRFPASPFPDAVLALAHFLGQSGSADEVTYWEHFATQAAIEMIIFDVVTATILPGVLGHPELDRGVASTHWWMEHGRPPEPQVGHATDEEKHLALSRMALNRSETANALAPTVQARAEDGMRLFAAGFIAQTPQSHRFPIERYLKPTRA